MNIEDKVLGGLLGFATADALGVPIEFTSRFAHIEKPLTEMVGYGSHKVPAGTWSDDTSMTIAAMDSIREKGSINYDDIMDKYCLWATKSKYTATDQLFDIGIGTRNALNSYYLHKTSALESGGSDERNNGNGSLMRMLPIVYYLYYNQVKEPEVTTIINQYSSLTHGHPISQLGCHIYYDFMKDLLDGKSKEEAFQNIQSRSYDQYDENARSHYSRILDGSLKDLEEKQISSSGFVVHTLEACIWTLLHTNSYEEAAVRAINLGNDTDTVGAITGSMAGTIYGKNAIPKRWTDKLIRKDYLENLAKGFSQVIGRERTDDIGAFNHDQELYQMLTQKPNDGEDKKKKRFWF